MLRDQVHDTDGTLYTNDELLRALNDGQRDIAVMGLCCESVQPLTATPATRSIAVTCITTLAVEYVPVSGSRKTLIKITPTKIGHNPIQANIPAYWFPWGGSIFIDPIPASGYTFNAYTAIMPVAMVNNTDVPGIPEYAIPFLLQYGVFRCNLKKKQYATAKAVHDAYTMGLKRIRDSILMKYANTGADRLVPDEIEAR